MRDERCWNEWNPFCICFNVMSSHFLWHCSLCKNNVLLMLQFSHCYSSSSVAMHSRIFRCFRSIKCIFRCRFPPSQKRFWFNWSYAPQHHSKHPAIYQFRCTMPMIIGLTQMNRTPMTQRIITSNLLLTILNSTFFHVAWSVLMQIPLLIDFRSHLLLVPAKSYSVNHLWFEECNLVAW